MRTWWYYGSACYLILVLTGCHGMGNRPPVVDLDEPVPMPPASIVVGKGENGAPGRMGSELSGSNNWRVADNSDLSFWRYTEGTMYRLYTAPERVTVIALQPGETLTNVAAGDTARWIVGDTTSGSGSEQRVNIMVKPVRAGLKTNLVITTSRRVYLLLMTSGGTRWMATVSWQYPADPASIPSPATSLRSPESALAPGRLHFRYAISGDRPPWCPRQVFDDGEKVYIRFPAGIAQGELPPLFVIGPQGDGQLVNYRFQPPYYVVDRLFGAAELRLGNGSAQVVRITRTDGRSP
ncbi:P-type conjugative transfer protein TrbG [Dickeya oryzae]|uniref:P-type conjugative transfer protein TrbG n=1 Tax=Dickeya oryzae TaxID=1240404 RepID=UPI002097E855|nr:P-type conjugative transfer protein TrbG [Dickeya oryzae]MCO7253130.1 P-type conjugative transfer protein TrbG [Dickeya oryzae]